MGVFIIKLNFFSLRFFQNFSFWKNYLRFSRKTGFQDGFSKAVSKTNRVLETAPLLIIFSAIFTACVSVQEQPPAWAENIENEFPVEYYLSQKGFGKTPAEAEANAARALVRYFQINIAVQVREEAVSQGSSPTEITNIEVTVTESSVELFSFQYTKPWYNRGDRLYETVAYIDRVEAWKVYEPGVRREENTFLDMFRAAENEDDALRRFMLLRGSQNYYTANVEPMRKFGERLHPAQARNSFPDADAALNALPRLLDETRSQAVIFIDCKNDFENRVTQLMERVLNDEGFRVSRNRAEAAAVFTVDVNLNMTESITQSSTSDSTSFSFSPSVQAVLNGRSGIILSYHSPPQTRTVTLTEEAGRRRSFTALITAMENSFPVEFRNSLASFAEGK